MKRHGNDEIGLRDQFGPGGGHHAGHRPAEIEPVAVLQTVDEVAGRTVIERHSAGAPEHRWFGDGAGTEQRADAEVEGERRPEALTVGPLD